MYVFLTLCAFFYKKYLIVLCISIAVAVRDNPGLKGKPIAVGTMAMVATACYEARKFGVRSGMPGFIAKRLCPNLIFVATDFKAYNKASGFYFI